MALSEDSGCGFRADLVAVRLECVDVASPVDHKRILWTQTQYGAHRHLREGQIEVPGDPTAASNPSLGATFQRSTTARDAVTMRTDWTLCTMMPSQALR